MTKLVVKKISFSTYVKFVALFGASLGMFMVVMALLMLPMILLETPKEDWLTTLPMFPAFFIAPFICTFVLTVWGVITYPMFLLIQKIFKKFTLKVEFPHVEYPPQPMNMTNFQYTLIENNNDTNQGVE
ncbi:MAG: hypothetical protein J6B37_01635 [Clostridia bacterium]|nr:hypothetical protein [Clostridia bacterium]